MNVEFIMDYCVPVVFGICICTGYVIKNWIPNESINKYIPAFMCVLGVALNAWINLEISPNVILGGMASGLAATGAHQLFKNLIFKGASTDGN